MKQQIKYYWVPLIAIVFGFFPAVLGEDYIVRLVGVVILGPGAFFGGVKRERAKEPKA